mgnify:CR=1 FL=1
MNVKDLVDNKLYIVAGERNMRAATILGGLYANVGMTSRTVKDRLKDKDYRRKNSGGAWLVILEDTELGQLSDYHIHAELKKRKDIAWNASSNNTEEFLFINDPGDGSIARSIVLDCLSKIKKQKNISQEKCLTKKPSDEESVKERLKKSKVRRISNFTDENIYWFKVRSSFVRKTQRGKPYIVVKFDDSSGTHDGMFVWNTMTPLEPGSIWIAQAYECRKGIAAKSRNVKIVLPGPHQKAELSNRSEIPRESKKLQSTQLTMHWKQVQNKKSDYKIIAKSMPVEKDIPNKIEKISTFGKFFIFFLNIVAIIYLFDFIYNYV